MKKMPKIIPLLGAVFAITLIVAGCGKSSSENQSSKTSMQNTVKTKSAKTALTSSNKLWYMSGSINSKSHSGLDAYRFDNDNKTVTIYGVNKMYKTYAAAQKAGDLNKQGTLKYSFKNKSADNPQIYMKGKLSSIPMHQTVSVKDKTNGHNKQANLSVIGYKVVRNLDGDQTNQVLVTANK